jgi:hypothetical protein
MRRRDREHDERHPEQSPQEPREIEAEPAERVLALQRSAGNRAVSALLARDGAKPADKAKPEPAAVTGARVSLPGIGTIPLLSVSLGATPGGGAIGRGEAERQAREVFVSSKVGEHSAGLMRATLDGKPMAVEVIIPSGKSTVRLKLTGALVSSYNTSGEGPAAIETWALNFQAIEHSVEGDGGP